MRNDETHESADLSGNRKVSQDNYRAPALFLPVRFGDGLLKAVNGEGVGAVV